MHCMGISAIALQGLDRAQGQFEQAGAQLASIGASSEDGVAVDSVDLSHAAVSLLSAKNEFAASLKLVKIADEMQGQIIDLLA
jgi:flagellar hook protein FlgE